MNRKLLFALALSLLALSAFAEPKPYNFAGIPWHAAPADVSKRLEAAGFSKLVRADDPAINAYTFGGKIGVDPFEGLVFFSPDNKLLKIALLFETTPEQARERHEATKAALAKTYGKPAVDNAYYDPPYGADSGELALKLDKAHFETVFRAEPVRDLVSVMLKEKGTQMVVSYEAADWPAEVERIRNQTR